MVASSPCTTLPGDTAYFTREILFRVVSRRPTIARVPPQGYFRCCDGGGAPSRAGAGRQDGARSSLARPRLRAPSRGKTIYHA